MRSRLAPSLPLVVALVGAAASAGSLIVGARLGLLDQLAGYSAGLAVAVVASAFLTGGMSLAFITGTTQDRSAVLYARERITLPGIALATVAATGIYSTTTDLAARDVALGGLTVLANVAAELDTALLQRAQRTLAWALPAMICRVAAPIGVLVTHDYSLVLTATTLALAATLFLSGRRYHPPRHVGSLRGAWARSFSPVLATFTISGHGQLRLPFLFAPAALSLHDAGIAAALISSQQTLGGVLSTALYGSMTTRQGAKDQGDAHGQAATHRFDRLLVLASVPGALFSTLMAPILFAVLSLPDTWELRISWALLSFGVPLLGAARGWQFWLVGDGRRHLANVSSVLGFAAAFVVCLCAFVWPTIAVMSATSLTAEGISLAYLLVFARRRRRER